MKLNQRKWMCALVAAIFLAGGNFVGPAYSDGTRTICHRGYTITVSSALLNLHIAHGDTEGPCQVTECKNR